MTRPKQGEGDERHMMTPAQKLAAAKPERKIRPPRKRLWKTPLKAWREKLGLTVREVAREVRLSIDAYYQIEQGTDPMLSTALRIADFYGEPVLNIWGDKA